MYGANKRKTLGFESLLRIFKQLSTVCSTDKRERVLPKLQLLIQRAAKLVEEHPLHAPVLSLHIARVTSMLSVSGRYRCVTCGGSCEHVHTPILQAVEKVLPYQPLKETTQLQAIYSPCCNPHNRPTVLQIELRSSLLIYGDLIAKGTLTIDMQSDFRRYVEEIYSRILSNGANQATDSSYGQLSHMLKECCIPAENDVTKQHMEMTLRDLCEAVVSVQKGSPTRCLMLYLGLRALEQWDKGHLSLEDIKSVCRIMDSLKGQRDFRESVRRIAKAMKPYVTSMNMKDMSCLLSSFSPDDREESSLICDRVKELLCDESGSTMPDLKSIYMFIKAAIRFCENEDNLKFIEALSMCCALIINRIYKEPVSLCGSDNFRSLVVILWSLYPLAYLRQFAHPFSDILRYCMRIHLPLTDIGSLYDHNELLSLVESILSQSSHRHRESTDASHIASEALKSEMRGFIECATSKLSEEYMVQVEKCYTTRKSHDPKLIRDLCHFLRICLRRHIREYTNISEEFNRRIHLFLLENHKNMASIDVRDLSLYLRHTCSHLPEPEDTLKQRRGSIISP